MSWAETFDLKAFIEATEERLSLQGDIIELLVERIEKLEEQINDSSFIGTPPPGAFLPRNRRYLNV